MLRDGSGGARQGGGAGDGSGVGTGDAADSGGGGAGADGLRRCDDCTIAACRGAHDGGAGAGAVDRCDDCTIAACSGAHDGGVGAGAVDRCDGSCVPAVVDAVVGGGVPDVLLVRRLDAAGLAGLGRDELLGVLGDIERFVNQSAGYRAEVLGALDALSRSGAAPDAAAHLSLRDATGVSERDARRMARAAAKVRSSEPVLTALSEGDITPAQAEALSDARVPDGVHEQLVAAAAGEHTDATRQRIRRAEAEHCGETPMERFERQRRKRGAGWRRDHEGMLKLWATFDPRTGAHIEAQLETLRRELWIDDKQLRNGRRTPAQRDADALAYVLAGITATDADSDAVDRLHARARSKGHTPHQEPTSRRVTPPKTGTKHTTAQRNRSGRAQPHAAEPNRDHPGTCEPSLDQLDSRPDQPGTCQPSLGQLDSRPDQPDPSHPTPAVVNPISPDEVPPNGLSIDWEPARRLPPAQISILIGLDALRRQTDEMGLTDAGTELPPDIVRGLSCDAEIIPIILAGPGGTADVGRARRTVPLRLRRLLIARDRHCQWPGCHKPPSRCDAHHVEHWANGGPTNLANLVLLCHRHHHHLHQHGYRMIPQPDGTWTPTQEPEPDPAPQRGTAQARAP